MASLSGQFPETAAGHYARLQDNDAKPQTNITLLLYIMFGSGNYIALIINLLSYYY